MYRISKSKKSPGHSSGAINTLFVLGLFFIFTVSVLFVLYSAASIYKDTASVMKSRHEERTALSYITTKIRNLDISGSVSIGDIGGNEALILTESYDGLDINTYIYCYDGYLREIYALSTDKIDPVLGVTVIKAHELNFDSVGNGMLNIQFKSDTDSEMSSVYVYPRCGISE